MRIYIDKLPKSCKECPMCRSGKLKLQRKGRYVEAEQCVFGQYKYQTMDDEIDTCPLQSISDYTKRVRKEICDKIRKEFEPSDATKIDENVCTPTNESMLVANGFKSCKRRLFKKLDEIQGE